MPRWIPLDLPEPIEATNCSLAAVRMKDRTLGVDIKVGSAMLRAVFRDCVVTRVLEDASIQDAERTENEIARPNQLAYQLQRSWFIETYPQAGNDVKHFRLIMPDASVDVLTRAAPKFTMLGLVPVGG